MISTSINTEHLPSISIPYFLWALLTVDYFLNSRAAKEKTKALKEILAQRNQKPEVCKAQCEQAIK